MQNKFYLLTSAFLVIFLFLGGAQHSVAKIIPAIDRNYKLPNLNAEADLILSHAQLLLGEYKNRKANKDKDSDTVDELLENYYLPNNLTEYEKEYKFEFDIAQTPKSGKKWLRLAKHYNKKGSDEDAAAAGLRAFNLLRASNLKAAALKLMSKSYLELDNGYHAINIFNIVAHKYQNNRQNIKQLKVLIEKFELRITDITVNNEQKRPSACLNFSKDLMNIRTPEDYISVEGIKDLDINLKNSQICIRGLTHGKTYKVTVKSGLKSKEGRIFQYNSTREFKVKDRSKRISFAKNKYILSRSRDNLLPITTVNLKAVELKLMLIHDRNLVNNLGNYRNFREKLNSNAENEIISEKGSLIWQGTVDLKSVQNKENTSLISIDKIIKNKKPGLYLLTARMPKTKEQIRTPYWQENPTQWLIISDIGLTTLQGEDGIHILARSLKTAKPLRGLKLSLIAFNNQIIGSIVTDKNGVAKFKSSLTRGKGGDRPALITATIKDDYNFISLKSSSLDLSERGVAGHAAPKKQDLFIYTDRGVYRPGGTVRLSAILRNTKNKALGNLPLKFTIRTPQGTILIDKNITGNDLGGYQVEIPISPAAKSGNYYVSVSLAGKYLSSANFKVEDFVPQRIKARISSDLEFASPSTEFKLDLQANFLYGPPATGLKTVTRLSIQKNPLPFPKYKKFRFGLIEEDFYAQNLPNITGITDDEGKDKIPVTLNDLPDGSHPLLAFFHTDVFDVSGRPVSVKSAVTLRMRDVEIGLKSDTSRALNTDDKMSYSVIALDKKGLKLSNQKITYELVKEEYYYSWYRSGRYWDSRRNITDISAFSGTVTTGKDGLAKIQHHLKDGRYRLNIYHENGSSAASTRFYVGWWSAGNRPNTPDALELNLETKSLEDGGILKAFIKAPFAGRATVMVMNETLHKSFNIKLPKKGAKISFKVDKSWGAGAYLMVTAFRPEAGKISKLPVRTLGLKWFSIGRKQNFVKVDIKTPSSITPRQKITLPIHLNGQNIKGQKIHLTIAAVDEGILGLTGFKSPAPAAHYLSQRTLGLRIFDLYGNLIKPTKGVRGTIRTGGDGMAYTSSSDIEEILVTATKSKRKADENANGIRTKTVKTVALFERDVIIDDQGHGSISLELPDFNGTLRLMSVAYGKDVIGSGSSDLIVRDPVVADVLLPRFMAPSDISKATLSVHNLTGEKKTFTLDMKMTDKITTDVIFPLTITIEKGKRFEKTIALTAHKLGAEKIKLNVTAKGITPVDRSWDIAIRPAQLYVTDRTVSYLATSEKVSLNNFGFDGHITGSTSAHITLTNQPDFNVPELLSSLSQYPYGCGEQTTSKALPLLYFSDMAKKWDKGYDPLKIRRAIDGSILRLLNLQRYDGSFALWSASGNQRPWLTSYIFEFLSRAKEQGFDVPKAAYESTKTWLIKYANQRNSAQPHSKAYAFYVLSRIGQIKPGQVRYFADQYASYIRTPLGMGHIAAALAHSAERKLADQYFVKALKMPRDYRAYYADYGTNLRDHAALISLIAETFPSSDKLQKISEVLDQTFLKQKYFSTQEKAWLLIATHNLTIKNGSKMNLLLNKQPLENTDAAVYLQLNNDALKKPMIVQNNGTSIRVINSVRYVPKKPLSAVSNSFNISRNIFTLKGKKADLSALKQNELYVVILQGRYSEKAKSEAMIVDLLPAGLEIENAAIGGFDALKDLKFVPPNSTLQHKMARDDRYVAALDLYNRSRFSVSYLVRAVTLGTYVAPAPFIEDMYNPQLHARGTLGQVTIIK
jgi:uncharacterized protein YfaS (alpha-2-macroglobulin family)